MNIEKSLWSSHGDNITLSVPFTKVNREKRTVSGFATLDNVDSVMAAIVGAAGLLPSLAAAKAGKIILLANKEAFEKMNPKDMAMAQLTETQQMSRGIDVIASYYKVRGAEMARGVAKGTGGKEFEELRASIDNYSTTLTSSQKSTIEQDAEKFGGKVRTFFGDPITGIGNMISGKKQPESTPPPPAPRETNVNLKFGPMPGHLDALGRDMLKNPNSLYSLNLLSKQATNFSLSSISSFKITLL